MSRKLLHGSQPARPDVVPPASPSPPPWKGLPLMPAPPEGAVRWYGVNVVSKIVHWFWRALADDHGAAVWMSNAQLYIDYVLQTGDAGPYTHEGLAG